MILNPCNIHFKGTHQVAVSGVVGFTSGTTFASVQWGELVPCVMSENISYNIVARGPIHWTRLAGLL